MTLLTKDQILGSDDRGHEDIDVPEWGGTIRVAAMTSGERDSFEASMLDKKGKSSGDKLLNFRARFVAKCIVGEDGKRLFSDKDIIALSKKSAKPMSDVFDVCRSVNGMTEEDVEEIEGN